MSIDVRDLLARAAAEPTSELDVCALVRTARRRRRVRVACALALTAAIVAVVAVVSIPVVEHRHLEAPGRRVPITVPNLSKTHAIVVTPSTGLRDRQIVRVSGGFVPSILPGEDIGWQDIVLQICRAGVTPPTADADCDTTASQDTRGQPLGTAPFRQYPYMVRRTITVGGNTSHARRLDCAAAPGCVLYAARGDVPRGHPRWGVAPLAFDHAASPLPGPSVTLTPAGALRDGATVTVQGRHFRPLGATSVTVCVSSTDLCDVVGANDLSIDANGSFSVIHSPWSVFAGDDGTLQNCQVVTCVVRVQSSENFDVPISFAPAGPAAYPQLILDPAGPYTDGQQVTVTVQGWPGSIGQRPGLEIGHLAFGVCAQTAVLGLQCGDTAVLQGPDADGHYTATLTLHRTLSVEPGGSQVDCTWPGNCQVALALTMASGFTRPGTAILGVDVVVN